MKSTWGCVLAAVGAIVVVAIIIAVSLMGIYNGLVTKSQAIDAQWAQVEAAAQMVLASIAETPAFEGAYTRALAETLTRGQVLCVASSMPVRDVEYFWPAASANSETAAGAMSFSRRPASFITMTCNPNNFYLLIFIGKRLNEFAILKSAFVNEDLFYWSR